MSELRAIPDVAKLRRIVDRMTERHGSCNEVDCFAEDYSESCDLALSLPALLEAWDLTRDLATNFDHDEDAHRYNTPCRVCWAEEILGGEKKEE